MTGLFWPILNDAKMTWKKLFLLLGLYAAVFIVLDLLRHFSYCQNSNDVATFDQSLWYFLHGKGFYNSIENKNHFAIHNSPILFLLAPIYALWQTPVTIIILQCLACASGILLVFLIAKRFFDEKTALFFAGLFALYHPLHGVTWDISNELCYVITPLFLAYYGFLTRRLGWLWIGAILAMACKEEIGFVISFFGIYILIIGILKSEKPLKVHGLLLMLLGASWSIFSVSMLIPHFRREPYQYFSSENRYAEFGSSIPQILFHVLTEPLRAFAVIFTRPKIFYVLEIFLPLGFLSWLAPASLWMTIPTFAINLLSNSAMMSMVGARYPAAIIPFVFVSAMQGYKKLIDKSTAPLKTRRKTIKTLLALTLACTLLFNSTPLRLGFKIPKIRAHEALVRKILGEIPAGTIIATQPNFTAHVRHGALVSPFYRPDADVVLLDPTYAQWYRDSRMTLSEIIKKGYLLTDSKDGIFLFRKKASE